MVANPLLAFVVYALTNGCGLKDSGTPRYECVHPGAPRVVIPDIVCFVVLPLVGVILAIRGVKTDTWRPLIGACATLVGVLVLPLALLP